VVPVFPARFDYVAAATVDEAVAALTGGGEDARILAGGQSLIPMMKQRFAFPTLLVDINGIPGLDQIEDAGDHLAVGALVRHADMVASDAVTAGNHTAAAAAPWISDPLVRNRGTVCGSVAHCDPEGDWNSVMLAVGADVIATSASGDRTIPIADFIVDLFTNSLQPGEMVTGVHIPKVNGRSGGTYLKIERKVGDYATAAVATQLVLGEDGKIASAGIAMTSVAPHNTKATDAEALLVGETPSEELFAQAGEAAAAASDPRSDVRGPADYKRDLVRVLTRRGLAQAAATAQES
jgi:aerobic carbon-monoxide dehydrogenase medium subunit